jgi:glycosyltransferase
MHDFSPFCSATSECWPFISVVTVSLNSAATIGATLASVFLQDAGFDVEHVCIDGGSRDGTRGIIDGWAARSSRIVRVYEPDSGIYDAMNKGLRVARGEYILFLNSDDYLLAPDTLRRAMAGIGQGETDGPGLVVGDVRMGGEGDVAGIWRHRRAPRFLGKVRGAGLFPVHQGTLTKRALLEEVGGFDAGTRLAGDVIQFYDLERQLHPSIRRLGFDVAFMLAGGAANQGLASMKLGSQEIYRHLRKTHGVLRASAMLAVKTAQSVSELRYGRASRGQWMLDPS